MIGRNKGRLYVFLDNREDDLPPSNHTHEVHFGLIGESPRNISISIIFQRLLSFFPSVEKEEDVYEANFLVKENARFFGGSKQRI